MTSRTKPAQASAMESTAKRAGWMSEERLVEAPRLTPDIDALGQGGPPGEGVGFHEPVADGAAPDDEYIPEQTVAQSIPIAGDEKEKPGEQPGKQDGEQAGQPLSYTLHRSLLRVYIVPGEGA